jgi:hypothetical protein
MPIQLNPPNGNYNFMCSFCGRQFNQLGWCQFHEERCGLRMITPELLEEDTVTVDFSE